MYVAAFALGISKYVVSVTQQTMPELRAVPQEALMLMFTDLQIGRDGADVSRAHLGGRMGSALYIHSFQSQATETWEFLSHGDVIVAKGQFPATVHAACAGISLRKASHPNKPNPSRKEYTSESGEQILVLGDFKS